MSSQQHPQIAEIDAFWARRWNCDPAVIDTPGVNVIPLEIEGHPGLFQIVRRGATTIVGVPPERLEAVRQTDPPLTLTARQLAGELELRASERAFEAGYRFYFNPTTFTLVETTARRLMPEDRGAARRMLAECEPAEVAEAEFEATLPLLFGAWVDGRLAALAAFQAEFVQLADVRVIVHPAHRRQGLARQVVGALAAWGLERGLLVQYECSALNVASLALARSLGCWLYAEVEVILPDMGSR